MFHGLSAGKTLQPPIVGPPPAEAAPLDELLATLLDALELVPFEELPPPRVALLLLPLDRDRALLDVAPPLVSDAATEEPCPCDLTPPEDDEVSPPPPLDGSVTATVDDPLDCVPLELLDPYP